MPKIEVIKDHGVAPANLCPHCSKELHLRLEAFMPEVTKIVRSKCPHCGGEIYAMLLIVTNTTHRGIIGNLQAILDLFNPAKVTTVDKQSE
jgi:hypothetical protein